MLQLPAQPTTVAEAVPRSVSPTSADSSQQTHLCRSPDEAAYFFKRSRLISMDGEGKSVFPFRAGRFSNVCFWHIADIGLCVAHVCF